MGLSDLYGKKVIQYPYRTARVAGAYLNLERNTLEAREIEDLLSRAADVRKDNHVVYAIIPEKEEDGPPIFVWCTDRLMRIGTKLIEKSW